MTHAIDSQAAVLDFLGDPATHGGLPVARFDTHAASVFLAGDRAFKIKRAVRFPFLDYSTLDRRKAACTAEIEINRRFAPAIYRGVVAITREADGQLALEGRGEPIEWAVEMRRFDERKTLDRLADNGTLDRQLAELLGRSVVVAHAAAPAVEAEPWIAALSGYIGQNERAFGAHPQLFPAEQTARLTQQSRAALARVRPLLLARGRRGLVRRGHGDLHLGNIVLIDGAPVLFDAIEFDPLVASGDVLYDLAFLLMDLLARKSNAAADIVFNRYLIETDRAADLEALAALPLFLSLRAAIRAKVTAQRLARIEDGKADEIGAGARGYFGLALDLIAPPAPVLLCIGGLSGTGKSVLARALAADVQPAPGAVVLRSDVERKLLFVAGETERLGADAYGTDVTARVYATLAEKAKRATGAGHSVIVDAVFADPAERATMLETARASQVAFRGLFLVADLETRAVRVGLRTADASDADETIARRQEAYTLGELDWPRIDANGTPEDTLARAKAELNSWLAVATRARTPE